MRPTVAGTAAEALAAAPQKKPWRYYYVMTFPVSNTVPREKLAGMLEVAESTEKDEEEYLLSKTDRERTPVARSQDSPLARFAAKALKWSSELMLVVALVWVVSVYCIQHSSMGDELDPRVFKATYIATLSVGILNAALFFALHRNNSLVLRGAVLLLSLAIGSVAFVLDELDAVQFSQRQLTQAISQPRQSFTDDQIELVLNGGETISLWHRFFVDGPAWFLLWLETHCVKQSSTESEDDDSSTVDSSDFFSSLWRSQARICTRNCLSTHLLLEQILQVLLTVVIVVMATQLVLAVLLLWSEHLDNSINGTPSEIQAAVSRKRKRQERQAKKKGKALGIASMALPVSLTSMMRVSTVALALTGAVLTAVSITLLTSCSFIGPTETWSLALVVVFGVLQLIAAAFTNLRWKQRFTTSVLVGGLALESYATSALTELCTVLSSPSFLGTTGSEEGNTTSNSAAFARLRDVYDTIFQQTCQPIKHWRLHVCVLENTPPSPHQSAHVDLFDSSACQNEFGALLKTSAEHALVILWWMMAAQVVALAWLLQPSVIALLQSALKTVTNCFTSSYAKATEHIHKDRDAHGPVVKRTQPKRTPLKLEEAKRRYALTLKFKDEKSVEAGKNEFKAEWDKLSRTSQGSSGYTNSGGDPVIFTHQFEAIVRTLILRRLTVKCKMDVSLSLNSDGTLLFAKIFASDNLLMTTLCQSAATYKLQLADAVDPGERFWRNKRELKNDAKVSDVHTIRQKLKLLQQQGVIARKEAEIFPSESMVRVSGRVQALLRTYRWKSGTLTVDNRHPPFVEYMPHTHLQYLYKKYPNRLDTAASAQQRRAAVLRTIDCLRLARQILDAEFDLDQALSEGLIRDFTELHSASRFDHTSKQTLLASWVAFWRPKHLPGEVESSQNWLLNQLGRLSPFRQPLQGVRDYFGECIAFYFAWLAFYNQFLLIPAFAVVILMATRVLDGVLLAELASFCLNRSDDTSDGSVHYIMPSSAVVFGLAVIAWGFLFAKCWERRSVWYQLEWGMGGMEELTHVDRANFRGEVRQNPITQEREVYFPERTRLQRQAASAVLLLAVGIMHLVVCLVLLLCQGVLIKWLGLRLAVGVSTLAVAVLIWRNGDYISIVSASLSEWENHQNERDFQRAVIFKVCVLQAFNSYGPLLIVAFGPSHIDTLCAVLPFLRGLASTFQQRIAVHVGVVIQLQALLLLIFITRIGSHLLLMVTGLLRGSMKSNASQSVESELALEDYKGSYEDYTEIFVQLGLVVMFSSLFPLAAVFAFVECALELRLDALDLCLFLQRPTPEKADGIGPWEGCVRVLLKLGLVVNLALLYFMADNYADWSLVRRVGAFLGSVLIAWLASELLWMLVPARSRKAEDVVARHAFLVDRYFGGDDSSQLNSEKLAQSITTLSENEDRARRGEETICEDDPKIKKLTDESHPDHFQKRRKLLWRLNVALRKQHESMEPEKTTVGPTQETTPLYSQPDMIEEEMEEEEEEVRVDEEHERSLYIRRETPQAQPWKAPEATRRVSVPAPSPEPTPVPVIPVVAPPPAATVEQYSRTALTGMQAIHVATEREQFDFAQNTGWQPQESRRGSLTSLSKRFSLFKKRRASVDDGSTASPRATTMASPSAAASTAVNTPGSATTTISAPSTASAPAARTSITTTPVARQASASSRPRRNSGRASVPQSRHGSSGALPVVQLSGLEAVHEATRRNQFDFSTDPWRGSNDSHHSETL